MSTTTPTPAPAPTQVKHPVRAVLRTIFAFVVGIASSWGIIVKAAGFPESWQWVTVGGAIAAGITGVLALPAVEALLQTYFPWLAAQPKA